MSSRGILTVANHQIEIYFSIVQRKVLTPNDQRQIEFPQRIDSSKIELMAYRCLIKNRTENLMRRSQIEEEVEFGVAPRIVDAYR